MSIIEKAMTVNISIGHWAARRLDREASRQVTDANNAEVDAARVNKHLVPPATLAPITSASGAVRNHLYANTLPWRDNGDRLLCRTIFPKFIPEHEELKAKFHAAVDHFLTVEYPRAVEQASFRMGELFDPADYPPASQLRHRFYITLDYDIITSAGDFRVEMDAEHADQIKSHMEEAAVGRVNRAMKDVWERMAKTVGYLAERMNATDSNFRQSTLDNINELVDLIPDINLLEDPNIEAIRLEIKAKLAGLDRSALKENEAERLKIGAEAQSILDTMGPFMAAFA